MTVFYKVIYNGKVIDVLDDLLYLKYQEKHDRMVFCGEGEAQAILSSDQEHIWHVKGLYDVPKEVELDTVELIEIDRYEYNQLRILNLKSVEEIVDALVMSLFEDNIL